MLAMLSVSMSTGNAYPGAPCEVSFYGNYAQRRHNHPPMFYPSLFIDRLTSLTAPKDPLTVLHLPPLTQVLRGSARPGVPAQR